MKLIVHGLGRMGMQIARKLTDDGHQVVALNRSSAPVAEAVEYGAIGVHTPTEALSQFTASEQVIVWVMLPSEITDSIVTDWLSILPDHAIIINGANADYRRTRALNEIVTNANVNLIDVGVSGGVWGYQNGFPLMVGGDEKSVVESLTPLFESLTKPGGAWAYFGPSGAGNYVKMVHNAIEYGMMQSLAEGYRLLHDGDYPELDGALAGQIWQHHSVITSWLNELTSQAVAENPDMEGIPGDIAENGETRWALEVAEEYGYDLPAIKAAYDVRIKSQHGETNYATKIVAAQRQKFGGHSVVNEKGE